MASQTTAEAPATSTSPPAPPHSAKRVGLRTKIGVAIAAAMLAFVGINLGLHFGQKRHDRLDFDIDKAFPVGKPFMPGEIYATTMAEIMDHELNGTFGWRPNDFFLWGPTLMADNNANRQIGILIALRETCRVFKDHLTKISSNEYDQNLVLADSDFRNDPYRWMLPSAEGKFRDGVRHLRAYVAGLHATPPTSRELNQRNIELVRLMQAWSDLLGDAHANLYRTTTDAGTPVRFWMVDNYFYQAQGYAHVMYYMMQAVKREYYIPLRTKPVLATLVDEAIDPLGKAAMLKPLIVLNGSPDGIFANHRRNLDAYISEARQKIYSIREELSQ
jgi:Uncharacterized protein conserved in bacteria (DUF2333)